VNARLQQPIICLITSGTLTSANFASSWRALLGMVERAGAGGVTMVQIREKRLPASLLFELTRGVVQLLSGSDITTVVNSRLDVAMAASADGVHLPSHSLPVGEVRRAFRAPFIVGYSSHSIDEASRAALDGADYVTFSPVFETPGKGPATGVGKLTEAAKALAGTPVIALGGVDGTNKQAILASGAAGFAAIRYFEGLFK
jgi:thiamine-phosphate pyrophosphorylase